jgi:predicted acylesterase/phospholipase RssA
MSLLRRLALVFGLAAGVAGCGSVPWHTAANRERLADSQPAPTRATDEITLADLRNGVFVGIAMSGGGSRAANFSAAVLLELEEMGFLQAATALSSVSGSSLTAAYYGLHGRDRTRWNPSAVRERFLTDFQTHWLARWFFPPYVLGYWLSDFDRSDIMKAVFNRFLFHGKSFEAMGTAGPKVLINATSLITGRKFVFTEKEFRHLHSRIDTFPVADAVMASGAFPGAFHNVTLANFRAGSYVHLFDGGPSDNLGIETLRRIIQDLYAAPEKPRGCFLFVVDAYTVERGKGAWERDTRRFSDFILDDNVMDSADVMLTSRRREILGTVNIHEPARHVYADFAIPGAGATCVAWHFSFEGLLRGSDLPQPKAREIRRVVNEIDTAYRLQASHPERAFTAQELQDHLFEAARVLVREDRTHLRQACEWFADKGFTDLPCRRHAGLSP